VTRFIVVRAAIGCCADPLLHAQLCLPSDMSGSSRTGLLSSAPAVMYVLYGMHEPSDQVGQIALPTEASHCQFCTVTYHMRKLLAWSSIPYWAVRLKFSHSK
jgi:hypothetical protein